jgi:hypothetical protein
MSSVDVIVPCYRYGRYLRQCIESILSQAGPDVRALIIDDASPDDSADVAATLSHEDSRVHFIHHKVNKGHIATYNEGLEWATGTYTLLISADDYLLPGALSRSAEVMDKDPGIAFTFGKAKALFDDGHADDIFPGVEEYDKSAFCVVPGPEFIRASGARNCVSTPTAVVRTVHLKEMGGYRPELPHTGDMEMWWRMAACGKAAYIGEFQAVYRRHGANMSLGYGAVRDLQQRQAAIDWFFRGCSDRLPNAEALQQNAAKALGEDALSLAHWAFRSGDETASKELSQFAKEVYPPIRNSLEYAKAALKQRLGTGTFAKYNAVLRIAGLGKA